MMILMIRQIGRQKDFSCSKCQQYVRKIQLYFPQCHLLRCYQRLCNDIIEKNKDDDTDDVEIGRFLEDSNFENGDECEVF